MTTDALDYEEFIKEKLRTTVHSGFEPEALHADLFEFQRFIVRRALVAGKYAIFADCGLGKTFMQLVWARSVADHTKGKVLILAPLAVVWQTIAEADHFGVSLDGITVTNYEQLDNLDASEFAGVVLDESSILKSFDGATKKKLVDAFNLTPYKLACTATPSPNDPEELGNHAEFLNVMSRAEMLAMYFVHDAGDTGEWRIKGHAVKHFWEFVASWAVMLRNPADIGFPMDGYNLPALNLIEHKIHTPNKGDGQLFNDTAVNATDFNAELRRTKKERLEKAKQISDTLDGDVLIWIKQNEEGDDLCKLIPNALEVRGDDSSQLKIDAVRWFSGVSAWKPSKKNAKNTTVNGIEKTKTRLPNTEIEHGKEGTNFEESDTIQTLNSEQSVSQNLSHEETQTRNSTTNLTSKESMVFRSRTMNPYSNRKGAFAPSAVKRTRMLTTKTSSMLTIATKRESFEGFYVETAITRLASSKTEQTFSNEQSNISEKKVLISKAKMFGYGINFQNAHEMIFASLDFSFEGLYQAIRREWRFGQKHEVNVHIITTDTMSNVIEAIREKQRKFEEMQKAMSEAMNATLGKTKMTEASFDTDDVKNDHYHIRRGDCVRLIKDVPDESVGFSVFSPPFADLFTYSSHVEDMGNTKDFDQFVVQFKFLVRELFRVIKPGRNVAVHCMDIPTQKGRHGHIGIRDFSGVIRDAFEEVGFIYHSRITIWKDPVTAMQRTKALGLLHKQIRKDSTMSRVGIPDNVLVFRKDGERTDPVWHYGSLNEAMNALGESYTDKEKQEAVERVFDVDLWQKYASPVWMDIDQGDTLNFRVAREEEDERHLCPLQIGVIKRLVFLYTNPGDTVFTPFMGIGSEVWQAVKQGRRGIGFELKESYYAQAKSNLASVIEDKKQTELF